MTGDTWAFDLTAVFAARLQLHLLTAPHHQSRFDRRVQLASGCRAGCDLDSVLSRSEYPGTRDSKIQAQLQALKPRWC